MFKLSVLQFCLLFASLPLLASVGGDNHSEAKVAQAVVANAKLPTDKDIKELIDKASLLVREVSEMQDSLAVLEQLEKMSNLLRQLHPEARESDTARVILLIGRLRVEFFMLGKLIDAHANNFGVKKSFWSFVDLATKAFAWKFDLKENIKKEMLRQRAVRSIKLFSSFPVDRILKFITFMAAVGVFTKWLSGTLPFKALQARGERIFYRLTGRMSPIERNRKFAEIMIQLRNEKLDKCGSSSFRIRPGIYA